MKFQNIFLKTRGKDQKSKRIGLFNLNTRNQKTNSFTTLRKKLIQNWTTQKKHSRSACNWAHSCYIVPYANNKKFPEWLRAWTVSVQTMWFMCNTCLPLRAWNLRDVPGRRCLRDEAPTEGLVAESVMSFSGRLPAGRSKLIITCDSTGEDSSTALPLDRTLHNSHIAY